MKKTIIVSSVFGLIIGAGVFSYALTSADTTNNMQASVTENTIENNAEKTYDCGCDGDMTQCTCEGDCQCNEYTKSTTCNKKEKTMSTCGCGNTECQAKKETSGCGHNK